MTEYDKDFFDSLLVESQRPTCDFKTFERLKSKLEKLYKASSCDEFSQKIYEEYTLDNKKFQISDYEMENNKKIILSRLTPSGKSKIFTIAIVDRIITDIENG